MPNAWPNEAIGTSCPGAPARPVIVPPISTRAPAGVPSMLMQRLPTWCSLKDSPLLAAVGPD